VAEFDGWDLDAALAEFEPGMFASNAKPTDQAEFIQQIFGALTCMR
jgi:hypothetical protein